MLFFSLSVTQRLGAKHKYGRRQKICVWPLRTEAAGEREIGTMVFCLWPPLPLACDEVIKGDCGGGGKLMNLVSGRQNV